MTWNIAALYRFVELTDLPALQAEVKALCAQHGICGTILLAPEGVNGTIAGIGDHLTSVIDALDAKLGLRKGELKFSHSSEKPFSRLKIRLKKEIITMRAREANPAVRVGKYVEPKDWNALISDPDVLVLDTRNDYETKVGTFRGAVDPNIEVFTAFKDFVSAELDPGKHKKVAMFCTGGIRCEKASAYMMAHGFEEVYHLKGGILKYLEDVPSEESLWDGACYVFDNRIAVGHGLDETDWGRCHGCGFPLTQDEMKHEAYEEGVSCHHCINTMTEAQREGFRMRHAQMTGTLKKSVHK